MTDPRDRSDALVLSFKPWAEPRERIVVEPHSEGGYLVYRQRFQGRSWRTVDMPARVRDVKLEPPEGETKAGTVVSGP